MNGKKEGHGIFLIENTGIRYTGFFKNDSFNGQGIYRNVMDEITTKEPFNLIETSVNQYIGQFLDGRFHGHGDIVFYGGNGRFVNYSGDFMAQMELFGFIKIHLLDTIKCWQAQNI